MEVEKINEIAIKIADLKEKKKLLDEQSSGIEKELKLVQDDFLEILAEEGKPNWFVEGYGLFSPKKANYYKVKDAEALRKWLEAHDLANMLSVNSQTLRAWVNAKETVEPELAEMLETDPRVSVSFKKS